MDMTLVGIGAIIGSGWLFAAGLVASIAGPAGWISWLIGGIALLLLGLVYAELWEPRSRGRVGLTQPIVDEEEEEEAAEAVTAR